MSEEDQNPDRDQDQEIDSGEEHELGEASLEKASGGSGRRAELDHMGAYNFIIESEGATPGGGGTNEIRLDDASGADENLNSG